MNLYDGDISIQQLLFVHLSPHLSNSEIITCKKEYIFSERYMYKQFYAQATVTEYIEFSATTNKMHFL